MIATIGVFPRSASVATMPTGFAVPGMKYDE
jgi:hypothetical protein